MKTLMRHSVPFLMVISLLFAGLSQSWAGVFAPVNTHSHQMAMSATDSSDKTFACHSMQMADASKAQINPHDCCDSQTSADMTDHSACGSMNDKCSCDANCHLSFQMAPTSHYQYQVSFNSVKAEFAGAVSFPLVSSVQLERPPKSA